MFTTTKPPLTPPGKISRKFLGIYHFDLHILDQSPASA